MPYARVPARIKQMIPAKHGQDLFVNVVNSQLKSGKPESVAFASAWAALQNAGYKKDPRTNVWSRVGKSQPSVSSVHVPDTDLEKEDTYRAPAGARAAAARALRWKEKYGDKVKGGTQVGWTRANQLANGENLSRETVARMASFFARHKGNEAVDPKFKDEPWRDAGHVAWLLWGGDAGASWARSKMESLRKRQIDDDTFTMPDEARTRSMELGLSGAIHVHDRDGQAVYMPGQDHEAYLAKLEEIGGIEYEEMEEDERGLLERAVAAIMNAIMGNEVEKNFSVNIAKSDDEQRIVWGWASVATEDGKPVVDLQGDVITPAEMEKMANDFMSSVRTGKAMHEGPKIGEFIHSMPLTNELAKAFDLHTDREGWIVAMKVYDDEVWEKIRGGQFQGFSIGGRAEKREALE
jgi:hypothetical protein